MDECNTENSPMEVKSLAELKRLIKPGAEFVTTAHSKHADMVGLVRVVTEVHTNCFYSKIKDQPEHKFSSANHGKGFRTDFYKASDYIFDGAAVKVLDAMKKDGSVLFEFELYDRNNEMVIPDEPGQGWRQQLM